MIREYDYSIKILLIGDSGVGKSSIMLQFIEEEYKNEYACTVGVDFKSIPITTASNNYVKLLLWDTAGQERFRTITQMYYRGTNVILVIYDVTDRTSFENIKIWLKEIEKNAPDNVIKILIGNKSDIVDKRSVSKDEAENFSVTNGFVKYYETSAKKNINIEEIFLFIGNYYVCKTKKINNSFNDISSDKSNIKLSDDNKITNKKKLINTKCNCM